MPRDEKCLRHLKCNKKNEEEKERDMFSYWCFTCSHGRFMRKFERKGKRKRKRREKIQREKSIHTKRRILYKREKTTTRPNIFVILLSRHRCLDIHTSMFQLPSCYLQDMITSIVSSIETQKKKKK